MKHLLAAFVLAAVCSVAVPQSELGSTPSDLPSIAAVQERRDALGESDEAARLLLDDAIQRLGRASESDASAARLAAEASSAPALLQAIRQELENPATPVNLSPSPDATLADLEREEAGAIAALAAARELESQLQAEIRRRQDRRAQILQSLLDLQGELQSLDGAVRAEEREAGNPVLVEARETLRLSQRAEILARIRELDAEVANYDARRDLLPARRDQAARRVLETEQQAAAWREIVSERRRRQALESEQIASQLKTQAGRQYPALQEYAAQTEALAKERTASEGYLAAIESANQHLDSLRSLSAQLRERYEQVSQRLAVAGMDRATGLMLRREFDILPSSEDVRRRLAESKRDLANVESDLFDRRTSRVGSDDINRVKLDLLSQIGPEIDDPTGIDAVVASLAMARRDVLADLENDADRFQQVLEETVRVTSQYNAAIAEYEAFIRERIFWVRSIDRSLADVPSDLASAIAAPLSSAFWSESVRRTWRHAKQQPHEKLLVMLSCSVVIAVGIRAKRGLAGLQSSEYRLHADGMRATFGALALTTFASLPVPCALWGLGWLLQRPVQQAPEAIAFGVGLQSAAAVLLPGLWLLHLCRPNGLAEIHFRWPAASAAVLSRHLKWFMPIVALATLIVAAIVRYGNEAAVSSVGRLAFTAAMVASSALFYFALRPRGRLMGAWLQQHPGGWFDRLRHLWYPAVTGLPLVLLILAWLGYFYTAMQLERRIVYTILLLIGLVVAHGVLMRWLLIARRKVAIKEARRKREMDPELSGDDAQPAPLAQNAAAAIIDEESLDIPAMSLQTKQVFRAFIGIAAIIGLYATWAGTLPALRMLDRIEVYPSIRVVDSQDHGSSYEASHIGAATTTSSTIVASPPSEGIARPVPSQAPAGSGTQDADAADDPKLGRTSVTLADIGMALIVLLATLVAFRNLPGLMEIVILQKLPLDAGSRYAVSTVVRYAIVIVGIAVAFGSVGISWSKVQWLAAALTFGFAFGLQEIFANFISGLIILAERPIRIGDTVTVGNVSGTVSRIRMRATTITDWDHKELLIPNKTFITGDVINWTLTDPNFRMTVPIGVSYQADVRRTEALLLEIAADAPSVLKRPEPKVLFSRFGESTLDFELRVFIPHIDQLVPVKHQLHMEITERFRQEGIEIAYPQRDLHIRTAGDMGALLASQ